MKNIALLIIDMQKSVFCDDSLYPYNSAEVVENINQMITCSRENNIKVIYVQHNGEGLEIGSNGWQICDMLKPLQEETCVDKASWDSFFNTNLESVLVKFGIKKLIIAGMKTEFCIDTTCRRSFSLGLKNILVSDAHTTHDNIIISGKQVVEHHNNVLGSLVVELKTTNEILELLKRNI